MQLKNVLFNYSDPPLNHEIGNEKDEYSPGENITCYAEANPAPSIFWLNENTGEVVNGTVLYITADMKGLQTYTCVAENIIRDELHQSRKIHDFLVHISSKSLNDFKINWSFSRYCNINY